METEYLDWGQLYRELVTTFKALKPGQTVIITPPPRCQPPQDPEALPNPLHLRWLGLFNQAKAEVEHAFWLPRTLEVYDTIDELAVSCVGYR